MGLVPVPVGIETLKYDSDDGLLMARPTDIHGRDGGLFFVGGAKQCGTTWLYKTLALHPDIWLPPVKELHCYKGAKSFTVWRTRMLEVLAGRGDPEFVEILRLPESEDDRRFLAAYEALPPKRRLSLLSCCKEIAGSRWSGDVDPNLLRLKSKQIGALAEAAGPETMILFVVRNPAQRHWSQFKKKAAKNDLRDAEDLHARFVESLPAVPMTYKPHIPLWRERFGERVLLLAYDDMIERPHDILGTIVARLGIRDSWEELHDPVNVGPAIPMPSHLEALAVEHFAPDFAYLRSLGFHGLRL